MVQVTGLEPTTTHASLAPEASAVCPRNKFRYHQIKDLVQFRYRIFNSATVFLNVSTIKKQAVFLRLVLVQVTGLEPTQPCDH